MVLLTYHDDLFMEGDVTDAARETVHHSGEQENN